MFDVTYHRLVSGESKGSDRQDMAQACMGIGDAVVAGFKTFRYVVPDRQNRPITVVAIYGSNGVLFGAYEFTRRA